MDFLAVLRTELTTFGGLITPDADLAAPVPTCGDWTFYDLVDHMGQGNLWVVTAVAENRGDFQGPPAPKDATDLRAWYDETADAILESLSAAPETPAWTFTRLLPRNVAFWRRRRAQETLMHRWDAQNALGTPQPFDPALADDGITEIFEMFAQRMIDRGLATAPATALRVRSTDTDRTWTYGPGDAVTEISATASDLLLALWQRIPTSALTWEGDRPAGEKVLAGPLVP
ncbi:maleylpyruvate isomerase family mycothiol-dependent enzyme [Nocardia sp. 2]|uniref:Maleylpyruvate isomerase family mycothiol-dependent enzyme n=1 Tax=Nocardia acididurans TaxID=2802282 RepID=A0ABS1MBL6_9NOCA|nr:maleylpyruvate isomerase family mycothiol-dependent enzyme [Nocardia acididurans]MBL1077500.1 maleylpyruvate isomerase family mycothiol-dependent enzyme [Nocardia acididurans]